MVTMRQIIKAFSSVALGAFILNGINQKIEEKTSVEWHPDHMLNMDYFPWKKGNIAYQKTGEGAPVLLLHSIGTGSCSYEWRKNIEQLAQHYTVYALDWIGFGLSDKPSIPYHPHVFVELLNDFIVQVVEEPVHIIASSYSAAYCILFTSLHPHLVKKEILICPTGLAQQEKDLSEIAVQRVKKVPFCIPILNTSLYYSIASKINIKYFLQTYLYHHTENVTEDLVHNYYLSAHYKGRDAARAALAFLSGKLDVKIEAEWCEMKTDSLIIWGKHAQIYPVHNGQEFVKRNPHAHLHIFDDSGLIPHDEEAFEFNKTAISFLGN